MSQEVDLTVFEGMITTHRMSFVAPHSRSPAGDRPGVGTSTSISGAHCIAHWVTEVDLPDSDSLFMLFMLFIDTESISRSQIFRSLQFVIVTLRTDLALTSRTRHPPTGSSTSVQSFRTG
jgi:hypothetical protein